MRRGFLTLLVLLGASSTAWAQFQFVPPQAAQTAVKVSADEVVARVMTFDQNNDGRVGIGELSERMRPLVARGDRDGDDALDRSELRALAVTPVTQTGRLFTSSGGYSFGDDVGLSSKRHIEGALEDLRLTAAKTDRALPIVRTYVEHVENTARAELLSQMETLLPLEQFTTFTRALDAQQHQVTFRTAPGTGSENRVVRMGGGIGIAARRIDGMGLGARTTELAHAAIERYKTRVRLGSEAERSELLARLKDVLDDEELENYGAALQRRPVVANSSTFTIALRDAVTEIQGRVGTVPAVFVERFTVEGPNAH